MGRRFSILLPVAVALLAAGVAQGEQFRTGDVVVHFDADFAPHALPRQRAAPVTVTISGSIGTTDGSRPPALRRLRIELNRHGRLTTRGLPTCSGPMLQSTTSSAALERCRPALVGRGSFAADLELEAEGVPAEGRVLVFNSRKNGKPALLIHVYGTVPVAATLVLPLTITRHVKGEFGTVLSAKVPRLAGGLGSITHIEMRLGRTYSFRGRRLSYISGSCAAPAGFNIAFFPFARGTFTFSGGTRLETALTRNCRVR